MSRPVFMVEVYVWDKAPSHSRVQPRVMERLEGHLEEGQEPDVKAALETALRDHEELA